MIEGIKVQYQTEELRSHLLTRAAHHDQRAAWYHEMAEKADALPPGLSMNNSPVQSAKDQETKHMQRAALFRVMADHLIPSETYQLTVEDLDFLEVLPRGARY